MTERVLMVLTFAQDEIARRLSTSRASVGRLLDRARRVGLVSINLNTEYLDAFELSGELRKTEAADLIGEGAAEAIYLRVTSREDWMRRAQLVFEQSGGH